MNSDLSFALEHLIRSYDLQIAYLHLLVKFGLLAADSAREEIAVFSGKMENAAESLYHLTAESDPAENGRAVNPALIHDLRHI
jgi:hypothetical protein